MRSARPIDKPRNTASSETNPRRSWLAPRVRGGPETVRLEQRRAKLRDFLSKSSSHVTRRWRRESRANPSLAKFPASWENTGNFARLGPRVRLLARNPVPNSMAYDPIPYASEQGIYFRLAGN